MKREYIRDDNGRAVTGEHGGKLFYTKDDGDSPKHQTVYEEMKPDALGNSGSTKTDDHYNPSTGDLTE